ncbi:MAG TPA: hypothetical protein VHM66_10170, partial [Solirubrobacterales bacterium]|nr:hypothetical protein [Solirubrobacterales bacterium]
QADETAGLLPSGKPDHSFGRAGWQRTCIGRLRVQVEDELVTDAGKLITARSVRSLATNQPGGFVIARCRLGQ